jgi:hypothetical protein
VFLTTMTTIGSHGGGCRLRNVLEPTIVIMFVSVFFKQYRCRRRSRRRDPSTRGPVDARVGIVSRCYSLLVSGKRTGVVARHVLIFFFLLCAQKGIGSSSTIKINNNKTLDKCRHQMIQQEEEETISLDTKICVVVVMVRVHPIIYVSSVVFLSSLTVITTQLIVVVVGIPRRNRRRPRHPIDRRMSSTTRLSRTMSIVLDFVESRLGLVE